MLGSNLFKPTSSSSRSYLSQHIYCAYGVSLCSGIAECDVSGRHVLLPDASGCWGCWDISIKYHLVISCEWTLRAADHRSVKRLHCGPCLVADAVVDVGVVVDGPPSRRPAH